MAHLECAGEHPDDVRPLLEYVREGTADITGAAREGESPVGLVVHQREGAVAVERDDAVAQAPHYVPEKRILGRRSATFSASRNSGPRRPGLPGSPGSAG